MGATPAGSFSRRGREGAKTFWESFFAARAGSAFEWYGDWKTLRPLMDEVVPASPSASATTSASEDRILVPGCGNSALSSELYDAGRLAITNVDFSPTAIREMMAQNLLILLPPCLA